MGGRTSGWINESKIWIAFVPYVLMCVVHVWGRFTFHPVNEPTKLALMPLLAIAVIFALSGITPVARGPLLILLLAIFFSWLGDGAAIFFPMLEDELYAMLLCFGIAHLAYMWIFWRSPGVGLRRVPLWALGYAVVYVVLMFLLVPHTGSLTVPVLFYGLVLVGTAVLATRCGATIAWGGFWFLVSDAILAFRIFMPDAMPGWTSGAVMLTYTLGQGLIAYGLVRRLRTHAGTLRAAQPTSLRAH